MKIGKYTFMILMGLCIMTLVIIPASAGAMEKNNDLTLIDICEDDTFCSAEDLKFDEYQFEEESLKEDKILASVIEQFKKTQKDSISVNDGIITIKGEKAIEKFDEIYYEQELKKGVPFPKDMIEDEFFKPIIDQVKKEHSKLVTENKDSITLKGDALKKFDELCMEAYEVTEGTHEDWDMDADKITFDDDIWFDE